MENKLTYRSLLEKLKQIPEEHLDDNPALLLVDVDEVIPITGLVTTWPAEGEPDYKSFGVDQVEGILDEGHPYFTYFPIDF